MATMIKEREIEYLNPDSDLNEEDFEIEDDSSNGNTKCRYSPELKMRVVLDSLRADRTQVSVAQEHNVSQPLISIWKRRALQAMMTSLAADYRREGRRNTMAEKIISSKTVSEPVNLSAELVSLKATLSKLASVLESAELSPQD